VHLVGFTIEKETILEYLHSFQMQAQRHEACNHTIEKGSVAKEGS
jgi:NADPH-dependent 7-cyano-7-deazaguanine reductase QueF